MMLEILFAVIVFAIIMWMLCGLWRKTDDDKVLRVYAVDNTSRNWVKFLKVYKDNHKAMETVKWGSRRFRKLMRMVEGRGNR